LESVRWCEIGSARVGPRLAVADPTGHAFSARTVTPEDKLHTSKPSYRERWAIASLVDDAKNRLDNRAEYA
jgi:hypothetical protein